MAIQRKKKEVEKSHDLTVPAGTEQETGFTRAETEKADGPVKIKSKNREPRWLKKKELK